MKKLATFAAILFLAGCASTSATKMVGDGDFDSMVKEAKASIKKAASVDGEWRDSGKFLKQAEAAAKKGDMKNAIKLVKKASDQGKIGYEQAMAQKDAGPWLF